MAERQGLSKNALIKRLRTAFASVKRPEVVSDGCPRRVCVELEQRFKDKAKEDLTPKDIEIISSELTIISEDALLYFMPRVLEVALEDKGTVNLDMLIMNLSCFPGEGAQYQYKKKRLNGFTTAQSDVILDIIEMWTKDESIKKGWRDDLTRSLTFWKKRAKRS